MQTAVVFFIFNRTDTTKQVFEAIRRAKPPKLLVVADGPRANRAGETEKCVATRAVIDQVDWDCQVLTNYSEVNLGCGVRVSTGINWVFSQVEEAIFLEDDCLPHLHFFDFCEELLERYRDDSRIMHISGNCHLLGYPKKVSKYSYYFSRYPLIWGWATWRRAWQHYDFKMSNLPKILEEGWLDNIFDNHREVYVWTRNLSGAIRSDTWDYQWLLTCWMQNGLSIHPTVNLVSNIGFNAEATHTSHQGNTLSNLPTKPIGSPLHHPPFVVRDVRADRYLNNIVFDLSKINRLKMTLKQFLRSS